MTSGAAPRPNGLLRSRVKRSSPDDVVASGTCYQRIGRSLSITFGRRTSRAGAAMSLAVFFHGRSHAHVVENLNITSLSWLSRSLHSLEWHMH